MKQFPILKGQWWDESWNPVTGCTAEYDCWERCWARSLQKRLFPNDPHIFDIKFHPERLKVPRGTGKRIFVSSMGDPFHDAVDPLWLADVFVTIYEGSQHQFFMLTKRSHNIQKKILQVEDIWGHRLKLSNLTIGVSVSNQTDADIRLRFLADLDWPRKFISYEPATGPVDWLKWSGQIPGLNWIISGCESGDDARPDDLDWHRSAKRFAFDCGIAYFLKQANICGQFTKAPKLDGNRWLQLPYGTNQKTPILSGD